MAKSSFIVKITFKRQNPDKRKIFQIFCAIILFVEFVASGLVNFDSVSRNLSHKSSLISRHPCQNQRKISNQSKNKFPLKILVKFILPQEVSSRHTRYLYKVLKSKILKFILVVIFVSLIIVFNLEPAEEQLPMKEVSDSNQSNSVNNVR